jgi:hypothetical protein
LALLSDPNGTSKKPWFSVKNGRLSLKNVSTALKFTTSWSLSTWPKSGLSVALSWKRPLGFQKTSAPVSKSLRRRMLSYTPTT